MIQAFYTGISGLQTNQSAIDITSDNLANSSTVGFRGYSAEFSSFFENNINTSANSTSADSIGIGSQVNASALKQANGSLILSDKSTDLAIDGDGWFGVQGNKQTLYTRDGTFTFDKNRDLVTNDGFYVLGSKANNISNGTLTTPLATTSLSDVAQQEKLQFPDSLTFPPIPTSLATFYANLGVSDVTRKVSAGIVDAQGTRNDLSLEFTKNPVQVPPGIQWDVKATTQTLDGSTVYDTQTGVLAFDASGALLSSTLGSIDNNGTPVKMELGLGYTGITAIDIPVVTGSSSANGLIGGDLLGYDINTNGEVLASFTNGEQSSVGRIALFHFQNDQGLERINGSRFQESSNSGKPIFFKDTNGKNTLGATLRNFKLESSNVDYAAGLTELIIYQRSYDANSKSITTADQMIQKALSMHK